MKATKPRVIADKVKAKPQVIVAEIESAAEQYRLKQAEDLIVSLGYVKAADGTYHQS